MPKKRSTKSSRKELAVLISKVLNHEETPTILGDAIANALCHCSSYIDYHSPDMIERTLRAYDGHEEDHYEITSDENISVVM